MYKDNTQNEDIYKQLSRRFFFYFQNIFSHKSIKSKKVSLIFVQH